MGRASGEEGDVVRIFARRGKAYAETGTVVVRIAQPQGCPGGRPGWVQVPIAAAAIDSVVPDPDDDTIVPLRPRR